MNSRSSAENNKYLLAFVIVIILTITSGWFLINFLGRVAEKEFKEKVEREANLTLSSLHEQLGDVENAAKVLSQSEQLDAVLSSGGPVDLERANRLLDRVNSSMKLTVCYLLDRNGLAVASSNREEKSSFVGKSFAFRPFFTGAMTGRLTTYFALGLITWERGYFVAAPVVDSRGAITGVVVVKRNIAPVGEFFRKYTHAYLVSPDGIIFVSSKENYLYRSLWPVDEGRRSKLLSSRQFGNITFEPLLASEPRTGSYVRFEKEKHYALRLLFGSDGWSLVLLDDPHIVSTYRLFGIVLTVVFVLLLLFFFNLLLYKNRSLEAATDLLKSKSDWGRTFDTVPDLIAIIDANNRISNMNRAMAERLGVSQEEAVGRHCYELLHCSHEPPSFCPHQRMLVSGKTESETQLIKDLNGDFVISVAPLISKDGTIESSVHVMHDISKLKQVEVDLRESIQQFLNIIQFYPDATIVIDSGGKVVAWNHAMEEITGVRAEEMLGKGNYEYALPFYGERRPILADFAMQPAEKFEEKYKYFERRGQILTGEASVHNVQGEELYLHLTATSLYNSSGETVGAIESIRDITTRIQIEVKLKKATAEAKENAQRLEFVLEGSNDATWEWDMITNQGFLNTRYYEMIEYTREEVDFDFTAFIKTIHPDDVSKVQRCLQDYLEGKADRYEAHYRMVSKSGKLRNVMGRGKIVRYDEEGRPIMMAGLISDVSEIKRLNDEVNRINNLESIGLLSGGLAHDFNNVLNIIYGNITFVKMLAEGNAALVEPLTDAEEACERAKELGIRLQAFSQGGTPFRESIALPPLLEDAAGVIFKDSHILHSISAPDDVLPLQADPRQIRQLFENLLSNAKDAMTGGGTVTIDIENCEVDDKKMVSIRSGPYVCITIQDDGTGIPEVNLPKIFDPYFSTKDTYNQRGLGLGLSICHAIMKRHNGNISVESAVGVGTRVTLYLPAAVE